MKECLWHPYDTIDWKEFSFCLASEISRHESVEEKEDTERKQESKKQSFDGADRVTVDMMDSVDSSFQR